MTSKTFIYVGCLAVTWLLARWWASPRAQKILFLIVSYILYASWGVGFLGILIFSSLANYGLGMLLRRQPSAARLWLGIGFNIALLGSFKLLPALAGTSMFHFAGASRLAEIALPSAFPFGHFRHSRICSTFIRARRLIPRFWSSACTWHSGPRFFPARLPPA